MIDQQFQKITQLLETEPQSEEEQMQQQQIVEMLPQIQTEMTMAKEMLNKEILLSTQDLTKIDKFFKSLAKRFINQLLHLAFLSIRNSIHLQEILPTNSVW